MKRIWARLRGDHRQLGDLDFAAGRWRSAARHYARASDWVAAARMAAKSGDETLALRHAERIADAHDAGVLLASEKYDRLAVPFFVSAGSYWQAAECALRSHQTSRAAALYEQAGALELSADCHEKAEQPEEAVRVLGQEVRRHRGAGQEKEAARLELRRARLLRKAGHHEEAARALEAASQPVAAAELWLSLGRADLAAAAFLRGGRTHRAAQLVDELPPSTDRLEKARLLAAAGRSGEAGSLFAQLGRLEEAIEQFELSGDYQSAGHGCLQLGEKERAADLFYRAGDYRGAANAYQQAGDVRAAARALQEAGEALAAAGLFLQSDEPLLAGEAFLAGDERASALAALSAVGPDDPDYARAVSLLAPLLIGDQRHAEAIALLENRSLLGFDHADAEAEADYWRARAHEGAGELNAAKRLYHRLATNGGDPVRDATERLVRIQADERAAARDQSRDTVALVQMTPGTIVDGRWQIVGELGRGGTSRVFRALDRQADRQVALKMLFPAQGDGSSAEERLLNEARIGRRLDHPALLKVFDVGRHAGCLFVTMELLEGDTLEALLQRRGRLDPPEVRELTRQIVAGLEAAHDEGVLHRDLKPSNVALTEGGIRLMDFGIAQFLDRDLSLTQTGQVIGSPMYMSPEQIQGSELDQRTDLYSLGILVYTLLTGFEPFQGKTPTAISLKHLQEPPPNLLLQRPDVPESWRQLVEWLLAKDRADRPEDASVVAAVLESIAVD